MQKYAKELWLYALRGGAYLQGQNHLRTLDNKFSALGVLYEVVDPFRWVKSIEPKTHPFYGFLTFGKIDSYEPTIDFGLRITDSESDYLVDNAGISLEQQKIILKMNSVEFFPAIANYIENYL